MQVYLKIFLFFAAAIIVLGTQVVAEPILQTQLSEAGAKFAFGLIPSDGAADCRYELYGSERRRRIIKKSPSKRALLVEVGQLAAEGELFEIDNLQLLARKKSKKKLPVFFRMVEICPDLTLITKVIRNRLITTRKKSEAIKPKGWFAALAERLKYINVVYSEAFPNLSFIQPSDIRHAGDGTNRLFVVELTGRIRVFDNDPEVSSHQVFIDLRDKISTGGERGLFSIAFHPNYKSNGYAYVHYTAADSGDTVIARYTVSENDPNVLDESTETIIFKITQPDSVHNGGSILFGSDGYFYFTLGDGGGQGDIFANGQNRRSYYGNILRIDVDNPSDGREYGIPSDNPYVGNSEGYLEEIYAYGFRNPWRASFDRQTDELYVGDVGQSLVEEINIVEPGKNYGWNTMEGTTCYPAAPCDQTGLTLPIFQYFHQVGLSVTGGYVYRGLTNELFQGHYFFGDFTFGKIFMLYKTEEGYTGFQRFDTDFFIATFGEDEAGELYFADYGTGKVYRFDTRAS